MIEGMKKNSFMKRSRPGLRERKKLRGHDLRPIRKRKLPGKTKSARIRPNAALRRGRKRHRKYTRKRPNLRAYNRAYNNAFNKKYHEGFQAGYAKGLLDPYRPPIAPDQAKAATDQLPA